MPYRSIEGITHSTGMVFGGVQITGLGRAGWRIEDVKPKQSAKLFADCVRVHMDVIHSEMVQQATQKAESAPSAADEIKKFAKLFEDGFLTQQEFAAKKKQLLGL